MKANYEEKNILTLGLSEHYTITDTNATKIPLTKTLLSVGSKLIKTKDGGVKIGSGIDYVRVSGEVYYRNGHQSDDLTTTAIYRNTSSITDNTSRVNAGGSSKTLPVKVISVKEGDIIYLQARNQTRANQQIGAFDALTFLNVEAV